MAASDSRKVWDIIRLTARKRQEINNPFENFRNCAFGTASNESRPKTQATAPKPTHDNEPAKQKLTIRTTTQTSRNPAPNTIGPNKSHNEKH